MSSHEGRVSGCGRKSYFEGFLRVGAASVFRSATELLGLIIVDQSCQADEGKMTSLSGWRPHPLHTAHVMRRQRNAERPWRNSHAEHGYDHTWGGCQAAFAAIKLKIFIGCNISPRLMDTQRIHIFSFRNYQ
ncbi:hypothetical protein D3C76_1501550 [compost metagenome]